MSRTGKTAVNSIVGIICSLISSLLSFVLQAVFIRLLGLEYAGINGLFTSILSILNLAELGINNAILFRLYRCIANQDMEETEKYLNTYKKICYLVSGFIAIAGIACIPFLDSLVKDMPTFPEKLWSLFIIVLATSVAGHAFSYTSDIIIAHQDRYISTVINYVCLFLCHGLQIAALFFTHNIYLYLLVKLFTTLLKALLNYLVGRKKYHVTYCSKKKLKKDERNALLKDVGSLATYKFCRTLDANVDTFLITRFVGTAENAIYGSINMLLNALNEVLGVFNDSMVAGIGDLYASKDHKRISTVFYQSFHFTYLLYGVCAAVLMSLLSGFTSWWIGYTLDDKCIYLMVINFYMYGYGMNVSIFRNSMGIFRKGWLRPAFTAAFNIVFSIIFTLKWGLFGTLLGTLFARTLTLVWFDPYLVCRYGMRESPVKYYIRYCIYAGFTAIATFACLKAQSYLPQMTSLGMCIVNGVACLVVSLSILLLLGCIFSEQKYVFSRIENVLKSFKGKVRGH